MSKSDLEKWTQRFIYWFDPIAELVGVEALQAGKITQADFKHINISNLKDQFEARLAELMP